ncbi:hypothetical protein [Pseudoxanthomonas winnipegensis]|uniref:hypothetical protein n=1 Tax=Pseudoxanthomonas winnipegensis TaxID=2480810 RepID=UPI0013EF2066|nr:hypothetical protein [Pseudoxanthomonas winnipegensis]
MALPGSVKPFFGSSSSGREIAVFEHFLVSEGQRRAGGVRFSLDQGILPRLKALGFLPR